MRKDLFAAIETMVHHASAHALDYCLEHARASQDDGDVMRRISQVLIDTSAYPVVTIQPDATVVRVNAVCADRLGQEPDDMVGRCLWDFTSAGAAQSRQRHVRCAICTRKCISHRDRTRQGEQREFLIMPLLGTSGEVDRVVIISCPVREFTYFDEAPTAPRMV